MVALQARVLVLVVLVTNLNHTQVEGRWMAIADAHSTVFGRAVAVGVFDGIEHLVDHLLQVVLAIARGIAVPQADVADEKGFTFEVFAQL